MNAIQIVTRLDFTGTPLSCPMTNVFVHWSGEPKNLSPLLIVRVGNAEAEKLDSDRLLESVYNLDFSVLDNDLSEYVNDSLGVDELVKEAVSVLRANYGNIPISNVTGYLDCNERTLGRGFLKHVGLTPKYFGRVARIQSATKIIKNATQSKYVNIAYDLGYFDQAHFIKDFKSITGITPVAYGAHL